MHFLFKTSKLFFIKYFFILLIFFPLISSSSDESENIPNKAMNHVSAMMIEVHHLLKVGKENQEEGRLLLRKLLENYFDPITIAKYSSMPAWRKASEKERNEFTNLFKEYLIDLASRRFNEFDNVDYEILISEKRGDKMVLVDGVIKAPGNKRDNTPVAWRLTINKGMELKIIDIEIAKISMVIAQNEEFTSIIRQNKGKFSSLIDVLKKELKK